MSIELPPEGFEADLGPFGPVLFDSSCGEPIAWGFAIRRRLGEKRFTSLRQYGDLECIWTGEWVLITKWLTPEEAIVRYGAMGTVERGPRGGFRSVAYGGRRFLSRRLEPR